MTKTKKSQDFCWQIDNNEISCWSAQGPRCSWSCHARLVCRRSRNADAGSLMRDLVWRCLLLGNARTVAPSACCLVMLVSADWWCWNCYLMLLEAGLQILLQSGWLLRHRLVVYLGDVARRPNVTTRRLSETALKGLVCGFLKLALKRFVWKRTAVIGYSCVVCWLESRHRLLGWPVAVRRRQLLLIRPWSEFHYQMTYVCLHGYLSS